MKRIVIPSILYDQLRNHLLSTLDVEREAFMIAGWCDEPDLEILIRKVIPISSEDLEDEGKYGLSLKDEKKVEIIKECKNSNGCLVEAHTHPMSVDDVNFSGYDRQNLKDFVKYINIRIPNAPYCATVWGTDSVSALVWRYKQKAPEVVDELAIRGSSIRKILPSNVSKRRSQSQNNSENIVVHDRQIRAFGSAAQRTISALKVGIVGLGGIGSHVLQQLVHIGVSNLYLVDDDKVEPTNMNRLVGCHKKDIGKYKTHVVAANARSINPQIKINKKPLNLRSSEALANLKTVDIMMGCVDNEGARLIMSELASAYLIPYVDSASSVNVEKGIEAGGRVACYLPFEKACLWCSRQIDQTEASFDLASEQEKKMRIQRGYFNVPGIEASVVSLNGVISSIAVNEFLAVTTGLKKPANTRYDIIAGKLIQQKWDIDPDCVICQGCIGLGDKANIERYVISN